ncbi:MAG: flagellar protein FlgN [Clostridiales bacterium]|jgi:flagellar biosynthesis/type III secretory pathway chaperone|nr:flagellar protein FlgN [Clostridiales bacterium]
MFDRLIESLQSQLILYNELLESARQKKSFVINNDIDALRRLTARENSLIGKLRRAERDRAAYTSEIAKKLGVSVENLTLAELAGHVKDEGVRERLADLRIRIRANMDELKILNEWNKALIDHNLEYIDFSVNLLRGSAAEPVYAGADEIHGRVFFDTRG